MKHYVYLRAIFFFALVVALVNFDIAFSQDDYPNRTIKIVVPVAPGAATDKLARIISEQLRIKANQPVIVENKAGGASGNVGAEFVMRAPPDGYTLLFSAAGPIALNQLVFTKMPFNSADFVPVSLTASIPNVLLVRNDSTLKSVNDIIITSKINPGKLNYGSGGAGTTVHITTELFKAINGIDVVHIPYKATAASITALLQGQIDFMFAELSSTYPLIKSGNLRALAVGSEMRAPLLPEIPTMAEIIPRFVSTVWYGFVAPPKTPQVVVARLSGWISDIVKHPEIMTQFQSINVLGIGSTPQEMTDFIKVEINRWGAVARASKISVD